MPTVDDIIVVVDQADSQVESRLKSDLSLVLAYGSSGSGNNQLNTPTHIALDRNYAYVQDTGNARVVRKTWADLLYYAKAEWIADLGLGSADPNAISIDKTSMWLGRVSTTQATYGFLHTAPYTAGVIITGVAGTVVGVASDTEFVYIADSGNNKVYKYGKYSAASDAVSSAPDTGYTIAAMAKDADYIYMVCNHAAADTKCYRLNIADLTVHDSAVLTTKRVAYAACVDSTKMFWTDTNDNTVNSIAKALTGAITSAAVTGPRGVACVPADYDDLPDVSRTLSASVASGGGSTAHTPPDVYPTLPDGGAAAGASAYGLIPNLPHSGADGGAKVYGLIRLRPLFVGSVSNGGGTYGLLKSLPAVHATAGASVYAAWADSGPDEFLTVEDDTPGTALSITWD